jgi:hypothetical protein
MLNLNNNLFKNKYLKYKNKYLNLKGAGLDNVNFYITDYAWFDDGLFIDKLNSLKTDEQLNSLKTDLKPDFTFYYNNLIELKKNNAIIVKESVDAFNINDDYITNTNIIIWGSPHWASSKADDDVSNETINTRYYTINNVETEKLPKINASYDLTTLEINSVTTYKDHPEYKGGVFHYLINKYPDKVIIIPSCDYIDQIFYQGYYDEDRSPYPGVIYYGTFYTPGYSSSESHSNEGFRCQSHKIQVLIYLPKKYKKCYDYDKEVLKIFEYDYNQIKDKDKETIPQLTRFLSSNSRLEGTPDFEDAPQQILLLPEYKQLKLDNKFITHKNIEIYNLYKLINNILNMDITNKGILFLGEHNCNLSNNIVNYITTANA